LHEVAERRDSPLLGDRVGVGGKQRLAARACEAAVQIRGVPERTVVLDRVHARGHRAGNVRNDDELIDLRPQRRQRLRQLPCVAVRDDDGGDLHRASTSR
jgi:hypothetical protein